MCGGNVIVFWRRIPFYWCKSMFMFVYGGVCGSCMLVSRKALFTLSIETVSFLSLMSRVKSLSVRESTW